MNSVLIVDDNDLLARALTLLLGRYAACTTATSAGDARAQLGSGTAWAGFVIDVILEDGSGLDVLESARASFQTAPAVVLSGALDPVVINRAAAMDARFIAKPCGPPELAPFIRDFLDHTATDPIRLALETARHRWALSPRELEVLENALSGRSRDEYIATAHISANTIKSHTRRLLEKTNYENVASLAIDLLSRRC